ncbi:sulfatase [Rhodopirellula sp. SWK7]|uniref:sulfatase n=1 Tax=Rhodopirellula sp. SWK7 TaxID=595460 RepID=UPI0002BEFBCC|nr:sulfatase [Rhodopirellula sp. SWK7]EMI41326.1 iduronate-2-sulfatase [Rhodopirellula sp. SWK7]
MMVHLKTHRLRILLPLLLLAALTGSADAENTPAQAVKKNVLFIAVDDLKPLLNCYGHAHVHSPNIDALAASGMVFRNAHCQQALCGPSRMSLLTGYYPDTLGIYGMGQERYKFRPKYPDLVTLPQHFKNNGYVTIGTGKIFDPRNVEDIWDGPQDAVSWTEFFGKNAYNATTGGPVIGGYYHNPALKNLVARLKREATALGFSGKKLQHYVRDHGGGPAVECYDVPDDSYRDGTIANRGIEQLKKLKTSNEPFFLAVGFTKPHLPFVAPKKYWDLYDREEIDLAPFQHYPENSPACAATSYVEARGYSGVPTEGPISEATQQELIHGYLACASYVDAQIGKLIATLKETGLYDNTVIVLWGDHGFHLGDKQLWGKHTNYEQSTRVPLIMAGPGVIGGKSSDSPVNLIDIFPTLCEMTDLTPPRGIDGKSLGPILKQRQQAVNQFAASIYPRNGIWGVAIRTERYRYVAWYKGSYNKKRNGVRLNQPPQYTELYDYQTDPLEQFNLSGKPDYVDIEEQLAKTNLQHVTFTQNKQFSARE